MSESENKHDKILRTLICPICGKAFIKAPCHVFYDRRSYNKKAVCSWKCVCISERTERR